MGQGRYIKNVGSVRELGKILGFNLLMFDPGWVIDNSFNPVKDQLSRLCDSILGRNCSVEDWFMGRLCLSYGLSWEFESPDKQLKESIIEAQSYLMVTEEMKLDKNWKCAAARHGFDKNGLTKRFKETIEYCRYHLDIREQLRNHDAGARTALKPIVPL